ncbi:hypothetical protein JW777_06305, partial [bacterium]|nr:hypothetical protein [bacterium]
MTDKNNEKNMPEKAHDKKEPGPQPKISKPSGSDDLSLHALLSAETQPSKDERNEDSGLIKLMELAKEIKDEKAAMEPGLSEVSAAGTATLRPSVPPPAAAPDPGAAVPDTVSHKAAPAAAAPAPQPAHRTGMHPAIIAVILLLAVAVVYLLFRQSSPEPEGETASSKRPDMTASRMDVRNNEPAAPPSTPAATDTASATDTKPGTAGAPSQAASPSKNNTTPQTSQGAAG